jgi:hypothetical protein
MNTLVCPSCGWDGSDDGQHNFCFRYLEEVTSIRRVEGFNEAGVLEIAGEERIAIEDAGANGRFECGNCLAEFPIPEELKIDFV